MRVLKYLRGHIPAVVLIVLLLAAQSFCELSLPAYTSRIVDTGIQSGGIEYAAPLALTDKTMDGVRLFLSDDDAATVSAAYTEDNGVWTLNDTAQLPELERIFIRPLVMYARLSEQGANTVLALRQQMYGQAEKAAYAYRSHVRAVYAAHLLLQLFLAVDYLAKEYHKLLRLRGGRHAVFTPYQQREAELVFK